MCYRDKMRQMYLYFEAKRLKYAELELEHLAKYLKHVDAGVDFRPADFTEYTFGGRRVQQQFVDEYDSLPNTVPIHGLAEGEDARGGTNVAGNEVRNLAVNEDAYTYHLRSYPRATSNSHYRYRPEFSPNNVIDGQRASGSYWRPARRTDLWLMVEFGREVETEQVVIVLHRHDGQDKTWTGATLEFSNGAKVPIELKNTSEPQAFTFSKQKCGWVKLADFRECFPLVDNGIAEFEVHGQGPVIGPQQVVFVQRSLRHVSNGGDHVTHGTVVPGEAFAEVRGRPGQASASSGITLGARRRTAGTIRGSSRFA